MDSLTHIILGAAIGEVVLGKKIGRKASEAISITDVLENFNFQGPAAKQNIEDIVNAVRTNVIDEKGCLKVNDSDIEDIILRTMKAQGHIQNALYKMFNW